jgi:hypothetical protein
MMNMINVESDSNIISIEELKNTIAEIASRAGYSGKVIFTYQMGVKSRF